ncbi:MAG: hypothetical protein JRI36_10210 [Deltaproteobacteria bacterium]|nr:hypothetical protein [Deltaproteobacteria bacterium]
MTFAYFLGDRVALVMIDVGCAMDPEPYPLAIFKIFRVVLHVQLLREREAG